MGSVVVEWAPPLLAAAPCPFRGAAMDLHNSQGFAYAFLAAGAGAAKSQSVCLRDLV
jgi:hypothetical protein